MDDPSLEEERSTTESESEVEKEADEEDTPPEEPWCPPIPPAVDDPTEMEIKGAADKLATMMSSSQPQDNVFYQPDNLGALPHLWLQAKLTISLTSMQEKFARLFMSIASELWLQDAIDTVEEVFAHAARSFTLRLAETLSQYICSLTRRAESLATPETECLLYATFWFRPILSELIGAAKESAEVNRKRAPSGPVKVVVTNHPRYRFSRHLHLIQNPNGRQKKKHETSSQSLPRTSPKMGQAQEEQRFAHASTYEQWSANMKPPSKPCTVPPAPTRKEAKARWVLQLTIAHKEKPSPSSRRT